MSEDKKPKFEESADLRSLAKEILSADTRELQDARSFPYAIIFTNKKLTRHKAGYCRKLDDALSFKTKLDYIIVIEYDNFMKVKPLQKVALIVHELNHIKAGERSGEPSIREHWEDFCEIPSHDKFSMEIATRIMDKLPTLAKIPYQTTLEEEKVQP